MPALVLSPEQLVRPSVNHYSHYMRGSRRCDPPWFWSSQHCCLPPQLSCALRKRGRKGGQVAEARVHIPLRRRMSPLPLTSRVPPRLPIAADLALRRRMARDPGPGGSHLTLWRHHVSRHLLHNGRRELTSSHRMLPPRSQLQTSPLRAVERSTPLPAGARRRVWVARPQSLLGLRRHPFRRGSEPGSMPLHLQIHREGEFGAINGLKGSHLVTVLPLLKSVQSPSHLLPRATEIEMQIARRGAEHKCRASLIGRRSCEMPVLPVCPRAMPKPVPWRSRHSAVASRNQDL